MEIEIAKSRKLVVLYLITVIVFLLIVAPTNILAAYYIKQIANGHLSSLSSHGDGRQLNDKGQVVWYGFDGNFYQIYFYDGTAVKKITNDAYDNGCLSSFFGGLDLNQNGEFVWVGFANTSGGQYDWRIKTYKDGTEKQITSGFYCNSFIGNFPRINNNGMVVWTTQKEIYRYYNNTIS